MSKARRILTNFSKGELSPLVEGRPDLAAYFEGGKTIENFYILRQGGLRRRSGTRYVAEVKDSSKDTILIPFEFSVSQTFMLEFGHQYIRFFKNDVPVLTSAGGPPYELVSPYTEAQLRDIHFTQSADVMYLWCPSLQQRTLSRVSDTNWTLALFVPEPPPTVEIDMDESEGTITVTPAATTGTNIVFTASASVWLAGDVGRFIVYGTALAEIISITSPTVCRADIIND